MIVYIPFYFQIWAPPTPPQDDNDVYIDHVMCLGYEPSIMTESQLPSVFHKKETKKIKVEQGAGNYHQSQFLNFNECKQFHS